MAADDWSGRRRHMRERKAYESARFPVPDAKVQHLFRRNNGGKSGIGLEGVLIDHEHARSTEALRCSEDRHGEVAAAASFIFVRESCSMRKPKAPSSEVAVAHTALNTASIMIGMKCTPAMKVEVDGSEASSSHISHHTRKLISMNEEKHRSPVESADGRRKAWQQLRLAKPSCSEMLCCPRPEASWSPSARRGSGKAASWRVKRAYRELRTTPQAVFSTRRLDGRGLPSVQRTVVARGGRLLTRGLQ